MAAMTPASAPTTPGPAADISVRGILLGSGPRFARDTFGPVLAFWLGWKLGGLVAGIALSTVVALGAWAYERRQARPGLMARITLAVVIFQAVLGLASNSEVAFLAPQVLINLAWGVAFIVSALIGRPLTGVFAAEMVDMPPEVRASATYRGVFGRISAAWGAYMVVRSAVRFALLAWVGVDAFVASNLLTGAPVMAVLMTWSVWYGTRGFRTSEEWGWAFEPQVVPATP
jgi:intracellular septation protein A